MAQLAHRAQTYPLRQWDFRQCFSFSWTTLKDKHCRHSIAVMGFVDMFGPELLAKLPRQRYKQMILTLDGVEVTIALLQILLKYQFCK